jgi:porphobilinogen synthase
MAGEGAPEPVDSMPGVVRHTVATLSEECRRISDLGIHAVAIFPCIEKGLKDEVGSHACDPNNVLYVAIKAIKAVAPTLTIITDVALDPYTSHGHDGLLDARGEVENDRTVESLCKLALAQASAGADIVAPSDMMDGRVKAIRAALDRSGHQGVGILAYSAKYATAYYGPFRDAVKSGVVTAPLDKRGYQMDPANIREALHEVRIDEEEGADMVMVKPAGPYLDIIHAVREETLLPVAAYQVQFRAEVLPTACMAHIHTGYQSNMLQNYLSCTLSLAFLGGVGPVTWQGGSRGCCMLIHDESMCAPMVHICA